MRFSEDGFLDMTEIMGIFITFRCKVKNEFKNIVVQAQAFLIFSFWHQVFKILK